MRPVVAAAAGFLLKPPALFPICTGSKLLDNCKKVGKCGVIVLGGISFKPDCSRNRLLKDPSLSPVICENMESRCWVDAICIVFGICRKLGCSVMFTSPAPSNGAGES